MHGTQGWLGFRGGVVVAHYPDQRTADSALQARQVESVSPEKQPGAPDLHAVFATDGKGNTYRVSDPMGWDYAQFAWNRLDRKRREGLLPQAKFFEVRSVTLGPDRPLVGPEVRSHGRYDRAELNMQMTRPVAENHRRGFTSPEDAARATWKLWFPTFTPRNDWNQGVQGLGGWYFYSNGTTAAQGLADLARVCKQRQLMVEGVNGRWYPLAVEQL